MKYFTIDPIGSLDNLILREGQQPTPQRQMDVVVKLKAATLNYKDLVLALGWLPLNNCGAEYVPLSDGAGEVVAVGSAVRDLAPGDRVVGAFFPDWQDGAPTGDEPALGRELSGMLSEYVCLPAHAWVKIQNEMRFEDAAAFPCAGVTAWNALCEKGDVKPSQTVLTMGTGGVSMFALQIAKAAGATVIATTGSSEKEVILRDAGADHVINYQQSPDWDQEVLRLTNGKGVDVIVEVGGAQTFQKSLNAVAFGGRISCVGVLAGVDGMADPTNIIFKSLSLDGVFVGNTRMLREVMNFFQDKGLRPIRDTEVFAFENAGGAYSRFAAQAHSGKVTIQFP